MVFMFAVLLEVACVCDIAASSVHSLTLVHYKQTVHQRATSKCCKARTCSTRFGEQPQYKKGSSTCVDPCSNDQKSYTYQLAHPLDPCSKDQKNYSFLVAFLEMDVH